MIDNDWDADALEYVVTKNSKVTPSKHLLSLYPSVLWISRIDQMKQISNSVKSIVIQGEVGRNEKESFTLSDFPSLISIEIGYGAFEYCHSIVFDSMNDEWMMNEIWINFNPSLLDGGLYVVIMNGKWRVWMIEWDPIPVAPCSLPNPYYSYLNSLEKKSMNDWMSDEWDLIRLQSITLGSGALAGDSATTEWNVLIMKSMNDWMDDWLIRSSFSIHIQRRRLQFH